MWVKVWLRSAGFHEGKNVQFNLTNHRLATQWIVERLCAVERWRAMRRNPTLVISQKKSVGVNAWTPLIRPAHIPGPTKMVGPCCCRARISALYGIV